MMVESLLDVLLQTLLSIMSKSHSVETSRGQRCPQCTAEITVRLSTTEVTFCLELFGLCFSLSDTLFYAGGVCFLSSFSTATNDGNPLPPSAQ